MARYPVVLLKFGSDGFAMPALKLMKPVYMSFLSGNRTAATYFVQSTSAESQSQFSNLSTFFN